MEHLSGGTADAGRAPWKTRRTGARWPGALALGALGGVAALAAPATAASPIAQRVVRPADIPGSTLVTPAARPMTLAVYVRQTESARGSAQARAKAALRAAGFRVGTHVALSGPGQRATAASAIQLSSPAKTADVVAYQLRWVGSLSPDTSEQVTPLPPFPQGKLVRLVSRRTAQRGWGVVFARGASVYTVVVVEGSGNVSREDAVALARKVLARAR